MRYLLLTSCAFFATTYGGVAAAQNTSEQIPASDTAPQLGPKQSSEGGIGEIVVTAQRRAESLQDVPVAVTALDTQRLEQLGVRDLRDISSVTPSLSTDGSAASPGFGANISLRGQSTNNAILQLEPTVGVYLDGVYLPAQSAMGVGGMLDAERVEVLKGPQGTLYGRNTTGGAISVTTVAPKDYFEGEVTGGLGNYGREEFSAVVNVPLTDGLATRFVGGYTNDDGVMRNLLNGKRLGNMRTYTARAALRAEMGDLTASLRYDYNEGKGGGAPWQLVGIMPGSFAATYYAAETQGLPFLIAFGTVNSAACRAAPTTPACVAAGQTVAAGVAAAPGNALNEPGAGKEPNLEDKEHNGDERLKARSEGVSLDMDMDVGQVTLRSITAGRWLHNIVDQDLDGIGVNLLFNVNEQKASQFSQELQALGNAFDNRMNYILGAYYYRMSGSQNSDTTAFPLLNPAAPNLIRNDLDTKSWSVFGQTTFSITDQWDLTGGLRYTKDKKSEFAQSRNAVSCQVPAEDIIPGYTCAALYSTENDNLSYLVRVSYKPNRDIMLYAVHSTGFKGGGLAPGSSAPGSYAAFDPETVKNYEIGFKGDLLDRRLRVNLAGYWVDYEGLQRSVVTVSPGGSPITTIQNAANARIKGVEAEVTVAPTSRLTFILTGAYTDAKYKDYMSGGVDKSGFDFQSVSKWRGSISGSYRIIEGPAQLDLNADYAWRSRFNLFEETLLTPEDDHYQDAYGLMNGRLMLTYQPTNTEVSLWGRNLFDKRYRAVGDALYDTVGFNATITGAPRTYGLTVRQEF